VRSVEDYITCLHELGHVSGHFQRTAHSSTRERWAWQYAREQALDWTEEMESIARACLRAALANAGVRA
jgi:antirestriction protein ArdC